MTDPFPTSRRAACAAGQPISELMSLALANPQLVSLAAGFVDQQTLPVEAVRHAFERLMADPPAARAALQYGTTPGYPLLREQLLARLLAADGLTLAETGLEIDDLVLTAGSNQLLHLVAEAICNPGDVILCAAPTYLVFLGTLMNLGARPWGVAVDSHGMTPEALEEALALFESRGELERVKGVYLVSYFDNPGGLTMPLERKGEILEVVRRWASRRHLYLIEDAAYRLLRYAGDDVPSLRRLDPRGEHVVLAETFSKSFSPGVRVGWGVLPRELVAPVCNLKGNIDFGSPNFSQHLMAEVLDSGLFEPHVEQLRGMYRLKLQAMLAAAEEHLTDLPGVRWDRPGGGLYLWLRLPEGCDAGPGGGLFDLAVEEGMFYVPGRFCYPAEGEPVRGNSLRLSFGVQSLEGIARGMAALARALRRLPT